MDNTPFSKRVEILGDFYADVCEDTEASSIPFVIEHQDTLWICLASNAKYVTIQDRFHWAVEDAWSAFCEFLNIDKYGEYSSYSGILEFADE